MKTLNLNGTWEVQKEGEAKAYPVTVPGSVLSGLLENKLIPDPFYREEEYGARELLRADYSFSRSFSLDEIPNGICELVCDGLDTLCSIYVNQKLVAKTSNMHIGYTFDVTQLIRKGTNEITLCFQSPITYMEGVEPTPGKEIHYTAAGAMTGNQYVRKAHSMFGWDWGPQLPDMGIWRDIYLRFREEAYLTNVYIRQEHFLKEDYVNLNISGTVRLTTQDEINLYKDNKDFDLEVSVEGVVDAVSFADEITIRHPKLWWTNRLGEQPLYEVNITLIDKKKNLRLNTIKERIGLRTITVSQEKDAWGKEFCFLLNGQKIFAKGADYIPEDCVYNRITEDVMKHLIDSSKDAGFNCLRIWGGGYYPSDRFFELCDEAGILVWQDFMFACNVYDVTNDFYKSVAKEAVYNVRRLRNHASLALFCGNNEIESAWDHWGGFKNHSEALRNDYLRLFEELLPEVVQKEAPDTFYWPSSPSSVGHFEDPDSDDVGDRHYWDVWHGEKPFTDYENYYFRFCSEFGFQSWPELATIRTFTKPGDLNIFSPVMESHQKNGTANAKILHYIAESFLYPKDFESLLYVSQVLQAEAIRYGVEHWRRNRGRCMGALYWQINDNWPVASWASIDYFGRWKALQYKARHFYADILGTLKKDGNTFTAYVQNETFTPSVTEYKIYIKDMKNTVWHEECGKIECEPFSYAKAITVDASSFDARNVYVEAIFSHSDGTQSHAVETLVPYKHLNLCKAHVTYEIGRLTDTTLRVMVKADAFAPFVDVICDEVPIVWSDNFFTYTGDAVLITGTVKEKLKKTPEIRVISLADSYEVGK